MRPCCTLSLRHYRSASDFEASSYENNVMFHGLFLRRRPVRYAEFVARTVAFLKTRMLPCLCPSTSARGLGFLVRPAVEHVWDTPHSGLQYGESRRNGRRNWHHSRPTISIGRPNQPQTTSSCLSSSYIHRSCTCETTSLPYNERDSKNRNYILSYC